MPGSDPRELERRDKGRYIYLPKGCNCGFHKSSYWQQDDLAFWTGDRHGMLVQEEVPLWGQLKEPVTMRKASAIAQIDEMMEFILTTHRSSHGELKRVGWTERNYGPVCKGYEVVY